MPPEARYARRPIVKPTWAGAATLQRPPLVTLLGDCAQHDAVFVGDREHIDLFSAKARWKRHNEAVVRQRTWIGVNGHSNVLTPLVSCTKLRPAHKSRHIEQVGDDCIRNRVAEGSERVCESLVRRNVELNHRDACEQPPARPWPIQASTGGPAETE